MTDGIGKALASAIKDERSGVPERITGNLFSNQHRRDIFSALTLAPCSGIATLSSKLGISQNSVGWHLDVLGKAGYVVMMKIGRARAHYPEGLIDREEAFLFNMINRPVHAEFLRLVMKRPGLSQSELAGELGMARQHAAGTLAGLAKAGVVNTVSEGAHIRYYPTRLIPERAEAAYRHSKDFSEYIIRRIGGEGGPPPVVVKRGLDTLILESGHASARFTIEVGINPYITCIAC